MFIGMTLPYKITRVSSVIRAACGEVIFDHPYNDGSRAANYFAQLTGQKRGVVAASPWFKELSHWPGRLRRIAVLPGSDPAVLGLMMWPVPTRGW
jgi:hypothetical protein